MSSISTLNPKAELVRAAMALELNVSGARGLQEVMKSNLGPKGTIKMCVYLSIWCFYHIYRLVSGSGDLQLTKDGNVLLHKMVSELFLEHSHLSYCSTFNTQRLP